MAKVHITLLGGQTVPVAKCILDDKPQQVIIICSQQTKESADIIKDFVRTKLKGVSFETPVFDPSDPLRINQQISDTAKKIKSGSDITINLTGGTKHWSILFYKYFLDKPNVKFILLDQNDNVDDLQTYERKKTESQLDLKEILWLNGIYVEKGLNITDYNDEDLKVLSQIKAMRKFDPAHFNDLVVDMSNHGDRTTVTANQNQNYLSWDKEKKTFTCKMTKKKGASKTWTLSSPNVRTLLLNTGWFEFEVAHLLQQWPAAKQIILNCKLRPAANTTGSILNEIDIIVQTGSKLLFVECKTQISDATDVDKFNNAGRNYGGLSAKHAFFTLVKMKVMAQNKCKQAKIPFFCVEDIDTEEKKQNVFRKLDNHMASLNER